MYKKLFLTAHILSLSVGILSAQVVNTGQTISIAANGLLYIDDSYTHKDGLILNNGGLNLTGNWLNESSALVLDNGSTGNVRLSGGQQQIGGSFKTGFQNLALSGTGYKWLGTNADVSGTLALNDIELKLNQYSLNISNSSSSAISRANGFISTDKKGKLYRNTLGTGKYLFPFGSSSAQTLSSSAIYRPVSIEPQNASAGIYSGTFLYTDASSEGYDRNTKRQDVGKVFDKYFYVLSHDSGFGSSNVYFYQNTADGDFKQLVKWAAPMIWEKAAPSTASTGTFGDGLNRNLLFTSTEQFKEQAFSFSDAATIDDPLTFFNAFSPDGDGKNDTWIIKNLDLYPNNDLMVFNRWGDEVLKIRSYSSNNAWDGGNLQAGTYFYVLNVEINGQKKVYKGFISMAKKN